jgi:uncharacterized protein YlxW (UPF0749 family)
MAFPVILFFLERLFWVGVMGAGVYLGVRYVRAAERRTGGAELDELRTQIQQLQETVETLRTDVDRVQESQDFTTRLLADRSSKKS